MTEEDLLQAHYKILLTILLKEFIKLNVNNDTIIKDEKLAELNKLKNIASGFSDTQLKGFFLINVWMTGENLINIH